MRLCATLCALFACLAVGTASARPGRLPPQTLRGPENLLEEYPTLSLATPAQRAAAERLLARIRTAARGWRRLPDATAAGFDTQTARRRAGDRSVHYLHAEHHEFSQDDRYLDPERP
ncbi:MAG TPA: hypothetical protein VF101_07505, partial [Gaiellaceae bacterium]